MRRFLPNSTPDLLLARLAASQFGLVTRAQAREAGLSLDAIRRRVNSGYWEEVLPGVYRLPGAPESREQEVLAATFWGGDGSFASHRCAAALRRWDGVRTRITEIVTPRRLYRRDGLVIHCQMEIPPQDQDRIGPIPVTGSARTLLDLGGVLAFDDVELALEDALRRGDVSLARLRWQLREQGGMGRPGTGTLKRLLADRPKGYRPKRSALEIRTRRVLISNGFPDPVYEFPVRLPNGRIIHPDFSYPERLLAIECQSYRWHGGRIVWLKDIERLKALRRLGWNVIEVTTETLDKGLGEFLNDVRVGFGGVAR